MRKFLCFSILLILLLSMFSPIYGQNGVTCWSGNMDTSSVEAIVGEPLHINLYAQTDSGVVVGNFCFNIGFPIEYFLGPIIDSCVYYEQFFVDWDICEFNMSRDSTNASFWGIREIIEPYEAPPFIAETPELIATFVLNTSDNPENAGAFGSFIYPGISDSQGPSNAGDTLGLTDYPVNEYCSQIQFTGGGRLEGTVYDFWDNPVPYAIVEEPVTERQVIADQDGNYAIGLWPADNHVLFIYASGYESGYIDNIEIIEGQTTHQDVWLNLIVGIKGHVVSNIDNQPIAGIVVTATGWLTRVDTTDITGYYYLEFLPAGPYTVVFDDITDEYIDSAVTDFGVDYNYDAILDMAMRLNSEIDGVNELPDQYSLAQNYPNPFNAWTVINYSLANQSSLTIKIYDALGRELKTLFNGKQLAGHHKLMWNASDWASGIYFYKITANDYEKVRSMTLIK